MGAVRFLWLTAALALVACTSAPQDDCPAGQSIICRDADDCRCGAPCARGDACPAAPEGPAICAEFVSTPGRGVCVEAAWATGGAGGRVQCGATRCDEGALCVDWGSEGVQCGGACAANADCASGCCVAVGDATGAVTRNVCAPSANFRCLPGAPARPRCDPPCETGQTCVTDRDVVACRPTCATDGDCPASCCLTGASGLRVCAADASRCGASAGVTPGLAPACSVLDGCVEVTWAARGQHCADFDSVEVLVRNDCPVAADIELCFETRLGTCQCGLHRNVQPGAETAPPFYACNATGRYGLTARAANDAPGCHAHRCN